MTSKNLKIVLGLYFWPFPVLILAASYLYLCLEYKKFNLLFEIIHENGKYNFLETVFYFDHFVREILICIMMSIFISAAFYMYSPFNRIIDISLVKNTFKISVLIFLFLLMAAVTGAVIKNGMDITLMDLFQFRTNDELSYYGSHWNFHFLHLIFIAVSAFSVSLVYRAIYGISTEKPNRFSFLFIGLSILLFILFTLVFVLDKKTFEDTRYLAHQLREIITHFTVTLPLTFAFLSFFESKLFVSESSLNIKSLKNGLYFFGLSVLIPLFLLIKLFNRDILSAASKQSNILDLLAAHYFEHMIDYLFVPAFVIALYAFVILKFYKNKRV